MLVFLLHFLAGTVGCLLIFLLSIRLAGIERFSAPFGLVFYGMVCGSLAHFVSPWATLGVIVLYAISTLHEALQDRRRNLGN